MSLKVKQPIRYGDFDELVPGPDWMDFEEFKKRHLKVPVEEYPNSVKEEVPAPKVSIHIFTYNHKGFIRDSIEGALMQKTEIPFEIIIGDDESTDGTREVCLEYAEKYPGLIRLFLHKRENNIAIMGKPCGIFQYIYNNFSARGNYIAVCSGDDYWTDELKIQKQYEFLETNTDCKIAVTPHIIRDTNLENNQFEKLLNDKKNWRAGAAGSWMITNFYQNRKIPSQLAEVIAEDTFTRYVLSHLGKIGLVDNLKPIVVRRGAHNMYMKGKRSEMDYQRINTKYKTIEAFNFGEYKTKRGHLYLSKLIGINKFKKKSLNNSFLSYIIGIIVDIDRFNMYSVILKRLLFKL